MIAIISGGVYNVVSEKNNIPTAIFQGVKQFKNKDIQLDSRDVKEVDKISYNTK